MTPSSWSDLRTGQQVKVFMGAGWQKGTIQSRDRESAVVRLDRRSTRCYDLRNLQT